MTDAFSAQPSTIFIDPLLAAGQSRQGGGRRPAAKRTPARRQPAFSKTKPRLSRPSGKRPSGTVDGKQLAARTIFFVGSLFFLELVFHLLVFRRINGKILYPLLFSVPIGGFFALLTGLFPRRVNKILLWVLLSLTCFLFMFQLVYYDVFKSFMSWGLIGLGGDAMQNFWRDILRAIVTNLHKILILALPLPVLGLLLLKKIINAEPQTWLAHAFLGLGTVAAHLLALLSLFIYGVGSYTPYDRYHNTWVLDQNIEELGLTNITRLELLSILFGARDEDVNSGLTSSLPSYIFNPSNPSSTDPVIDTSPNTMAIDFEALAAGETNEKIRTLHEYFAGIPGTNKNAYTGMFQDYNLIMLCCEAFSPYVIDPQLTPTLYRMANEGFVFSNFYTMFPSVTTNGEYAFCTGLIPDMSRVKTNGSFKASANNWLPFCMGHQFNKLGYTSRAYHDYIYSYYDRHKTHPNMGYIYKASGKGMKFTNNWPLSDIEMMEQSIPEYIGDAKFHTYYMTVSGHLAYVHNAGNEMVDKNWSKVKDLPYRTSVKAYLSCNLELEYAMQYLLEKLEAAGVADKTVIALTTDHYPYGLHLFEYSQLAGFEVDEDFGKYKNSFILWNPGMKETITIDKPCCTIDILPTLSNLFGLEYDSRLLMGTDILSDAAPIAILSNQSFITDKVMFNSRNGEITYLTNDPLPDGYVDALIQHVKNKFTVSTAILNNDYYSYVIPRS